MVDYDPTKRIVRGPRVPQIYHKNISVGQVILCEIYKYLNKVLQVNHDDGSELTGSQIGDMMINVAKNLYRLGLRSGDVAGFCASNTTYVAPIIFGCLLLKMPLNPVDNMFEVEEIVRIFEKTRPKIVFCDHDNVEKITDVLRRIGIDAIMLTLTEKVRGLFHISDLLHNYSININE